MNQHPVITTLNADQLHGYAAAMEEVGARDATYATGLRSFAADRAAIARGLIAREPPVAIRYWREYLHPDDGDEDLFEALRVSDDVEHLTPFAMRSTAWRGRRWVVWEPWDDKGVTQTFATEAEAKAHCDAWQADGAAREEGADAAKALADAVAADLAGALHSQATPPAPTGGPPAAPEQRPEPTPAPAANHRRGDKTTDEQRTAMQRRYEAGQGCSEIGRAFGVSGQAVNHLVKTRCWQRNPPPSRTDPATTPAANVATTSLAAPAGDEPTEADQLEARRDVLEHGRGAKWIAEEYGWELVFAQSFCARVREAANTQPESTAT